jgi:hypothetical protein
VERSVFAMRAATILLIAEIMCWIAGMGLA